MSLHLFLRYDAAIFSRSMWCLEQFTAAAKTCPGCCCRCWSSSSQVGMAVQFPCINLAIDNNPLRFEFESRCLQRPAFQSPQRASPATCARPRVSSLTCRVSGLDSPRGPATSPPQRALQCLVMGDTISKSDDLSHLSLIFCRDLSRNAITMLVPVDLQTMPALQLLCVARWNCDYSHIKLQESERECDHIDWGWDICRRTRAVHAVSGWCGVAWISAQTRHCTPSHRRTHTQGSVTYTII